MNVGKPGGPAGPSPSSDLSPSGGAGGATPAGPERKFSEVLAGNKGGQDPTGPGKAEANPFKVPILDDFGVVAPGGKARYQSTERTQKVQGTSRSIEVAGEKVGKSPPPVAPAGVEGGNRTGWQKMADDTFKSESRIDHLIKQAQGGKSFNASELMALQVEVFRYSQTIEVISRTTDKLVGAVKQTLGTQV